MPFSRKEKGKGTCCPVSVSLLSLSFSAFEIQPHRSLLREPALLLHVGDAADPDADLGGGGEEQLNTCAGLAESLV